MLRTRFNVPSELSQSRVIQVVGQEKHEPDKRFKVRGTGDMIFWCVSVVDRQPRGFAFAIGSDELTKYQQVS